MRVVVIGAGVSGLTTAVVLREAGCDVTICARETRDTTSAAAAAIWFPYHIAPEALPWAEATRAVLERLASDARTGVTLVDLDLLDSGETWRVPLMDTSRYLPYLRDRFGGDILAREIRSFAELEGDALVNCSGFGARELCGDDELHPGFGIAVIADRIPVGRAIVRTTDSDRLMYVIPRAADCVLGGYDREDPADGHQAQKIRERCAAVLQQEHSADP